jgi:hypothetical protein
MDGKVKSIREGVFVTPKSVEDILADLDLVREHITSGTYQPQFGMVVILDHDSHVVHFTLGGVTKLDAVGILEYAKGTVIKDG